MNLYKMKKADIIWAASHHCKHRHTFLAHPECYDAEHPETRRTGFFDIESFGLDASFGVLLSWSLKPAGKPQIISDVFQAADLKREKPGEEERV